jgi:hypothetical protein
VLEAIQVIGIDKLPPGQKEREGLIISWVKERRKLRVSERFVRDLLKARKEELKARKAKCES